MLSKVVFVVELTLLMIVPLLPVRLIDPARFVLSPNPVKLQFLMLTFFLSAMMSALWFEVPPVPLMRNPAQSKTMLSAVMLIPNPVQVVEVIGSLLLSVTLLLRFAPQSMVDVADVVIFVTLTA